MNIRLNVSRFLSYYTGDQKCIDVKGATVGECLDCLVKKFPVLLDIVQSSDGSVASYIAVFKNQDGETPEKLDSQVEDGEEYFVEYQPG
jgi:hypothetical protein